MLQVAALRPNCTAAAAAGAHRTLLLTTTRGSGSATSSSSAFLRCRAIAATDHPTPTIPSSSAVSTRPMAHPFLNYNLRGRYNVSPGDHPDYLCLHHHQARRPGASSGNLSTGRLRILRREPSLNSMSRGTRQPAVVYCTASSASGGGDGPEKLATSGARENDSSVLTAPTARRRRGGGRTACAAPKAGSEDDMVYRNTVYDHCDWNRHRSNTRHSRHMLAVASSRVVAGLLPPVLKLTLVAAVVALANRWWGPLLVVSSLPFQLAAPAVALLLVFRTNASYGRFDEARKSWAAVANRTRDMARQLVAFAAQRRDLQDLRRLLRYLVAFPYCLKDHLTRGEELEAELERIMASEAEIDGVLGSPHRPAHVLQVMTALVHDSPHLNDMQKALLDANLTNLHDSVGACERIFTTPIPLSYTRLTSRILVLWHLLLPLALWEQCTWVTVPATFLSAAVFFCIEEVGVLIEEPFSILPLANISDTVRQSVDTIFRQHQGIMVHTSF